MLYSKVDGKSRNNQDGKVSLQHCSTCSIDARLHFDFEQPFNSLIRQCLQQLSSGTTMLCLTFHKCHCFLLSGAFEIAFEPYKPYSRTVAESAMLCPMLYLLLLQLFV